MYHERGDQRREERKKGGGGVEEEGVTEITVYITMLTPSSKVVKMPRGFGVFGRS